jgi:hypothetical protein
LDILFASKRERTHHMGKRRVGEKGLLWLFNTFSCIQFGLLFWHRSEAGVGMKRAREKEENFP